MVQKVISRETERAAVEALPLWYTKSSGSMTRDHQGGGVGEGRKEVGLLCYLNPLSLIPQRIFN